MTIATPNPSVVFDKRPSIELSPEEAAMYLVQGIRSRSLRNIADLKAYALEIFPDLTEDQRDSHLRHLANRLTLNETPPRRRPTPGR